MSTSNAAASRCVPIVAIHGGAGTILRSDSSPQTQARYRAELRAVLLAAQRLLAQGASAVDVVTEAVRLLEECELFNAGRGAVFNADAQHELDACVMRGQDLAVGAVAGVRRLRNPVLVARRLMETGPAVFLIGEGAERYAKEQGCELVAPDWFSTPHRLAQLHKAQGTTSGMTLDHDLRTPPLDERGKMGTVGAVALDAQGHLAAATSTGGMTNKRPGRVGDSPVVGAGTYADDRSVAVSCTGAGEAFIRGMAAYEISALMRLSGAGLLEAAQQVVHELLPPLGGRGGLIAVDANGQVTLPCNTPGMYRGWARAGGDVFTAIYADEGEGTGLPPNPLPR